MNNFKKIGLTALAASLVSVSANAGEISVAGGASLNVEGFSGEQLNAGKSYTMGNQLTFTGGGELDNGLTVAVSFVMDQADAAPSPFDSHSVTISSDAMGSLKFMGEGGSTAASAIDGSAAGDIWDKFDGLTNASAQVSKSGVTGDGVTATAGDNAFIYTTPELMEGLTATASYAPQASGAETRASGMGYGLAYTGVEGLTLKYAKADIVNSTKALSGEQTVMYASYAYGPVTVSYSNFEGDLDTASKDYELTSAAISYTVSDELSVTYGMEDAEQEGATSDAEYETLSLSYVTGGMTISAGMHEAENANFGTASTQDIEKWTLGASFAF
ncbi:porin [Candidatus Pelagibacter bacterium nBUS_29]|uniref:porin n=1 Tax=Candidatus Pelagibacter bacterium nBUS_29 TaxID=3374190 RepID=UPI003EB84321